MGETKLNRIAAYVEPHIHKELNRICEQKGCTMSVLVARFIENQLSLAEPANSFSSSSSLTDSAEKTLVENEIKSLQAEVSNLQAVVAEIRNNPENELANSAGSAVAQLTPQLAQLRENPSNKPEFQHLPNSQAQASSAESSKLVMTQLKENRNRLEGEKEELEVELEETYKELEKNYRQIIYLKAENNDLRTKLIEKDLKDLFAILNEINHAKRNETLLSELAKYKSESAEYKAWIKEACRRNNILCYL